MKHMTGNSPFLTDLLYKSPVPVCLLSTDPMMYMHSRKFKIQRLLQFSQDCEHQHGITSPVTISILATLNRE